MAKSKKEKQAPAPTAVVEQQTEPTPAPELKVQDVTPEPKPEKSRPVLTQEIVTATFNRELTLLKFQTNLQSLLDWKVTEDNIPETQAVTKKGRGLVTDLKKIKDKLKRPALDECDMWEAAFKSFLKPLEEALSAKDKELQLISLRIQQEDERKKREQARVDGIKKAIDDFILQQSYVIASATKADQLVAIEKVLGSHKGNSSRYQEFLPELVNRCNELTPLIKKQKEFIKELEELEKKKQEATQTGDDRKLLELQEKEEVISNAIDEKKLQVQETAIQQAIRPDDVTVPDPVLANLNPRRRTWDYEVVDEKKAFLAGMLITEPNKDKVKAKLLEIKDGIVADKQTEKIVDGIRYFYKVVY